LITMPTATAAVIMSVFIVPSLVAGSSSRRILFNVDVRRLYTENASIRATSQAREQGICQAAASFARLEQARAASLCFPLCPQTTDIERPRQHAEKCH
jgi:hypothetical protein